MFPPQLKHELSSYAVSVDRQPLHALPATTEDFICGLQEWSGAEHAGVAVSYFFRQYALFVSAQFNLITHHNGYFAGSIEQMSFDRVHNYGFNLLQTHVRSADFQLISPEERFDAFHFILHEQIAAFISEFRIHVKISPIILWENILGSLIWFYANLEKRNPRRAAEDMEWLMDAANWAPLKKSYLAAMLGTASLEQAVSRPLRKTCCLYKELPHFDTCAFCPQPH
ncbi:hypothetical protein [Planococcus salinus]|uniref:Aerobactin siderophore biosynthesis IucA/IucC-like C-terminal domain-containing protein n=1 Tax=Planococcus salinus TaxID=1848460 RepID=A0A3M8P960_9BACL|nr:hypothetical protein [Planococcus salinus]RNF40152.1 hypothetical protein EEX84_05805 [Planococcus salinus]